MIRLRQNLTRDYKTPSTFSEQKKYRDKDGPQRIENKTKQRKVKVKDTDRAVTSHWRVDTMKPSPPKQAADYKKRNKPIKWHRHGIMYAYGMLSLVERANRCQSLRTLTHATIGLPQNYHAKKIWCPSLEELRTSPKRKFFRRYVGQKSVENPMNHHTR